MGTLDVGDVPDEKVLSVLKDMIQSIVPKKAKSLGDDTDLFNYGVDSVAGMQIRYGLRQLLPDAGPQQLPLNIVDDCGTVARLAEYVVKQRHGESFSREDDAAEHKLMLELVEKYSQFQIPDGLANGDGQVESVQADRKDVVVLTGATGALGAHLLSLYAHDTSIAKIYCLVRGADSRAAKERVKKALAQRGLEDLNDKKIVVLQAQLGEPRLGLSASVYEQVVEEVSIIMHVAWSVNFRMRLRSFEKDNIASKFSPVVVAMCCILL